MIFLPSIVLADGGLIMPPDMKEKISLPEQKAVIIWEDGEETLILSTKIHYNQKYWGYQSFIYLVIVFILVSIYHLSFGNFPKS